MPVPTAQDKAAEVIDKVEAGKELTAVEQRAYDKAMAEANEQAGYEPYTHPGNLTFYRILESPSHTFEHEWEAQRFVAVMRVTRNLAAG